MADPIRQLLSQTNYVADGSQTVWNFSFSGGYIDKSHVKAKYLDAARVEHQIAVTPGMFLGQYQLNITPPVAAGSELVIYRDTPKSGPLVDFIDAASLTEASLDLSAKQGVFVAAESSDLLVTTIASTDQLQAKLVQAEAARAGAAVAEAGAASQASASADSAAESLGYLQACRATSYGALSSDPVTDPLGNPPTVGDEYFNTSANLLKRWNGATWQASDINTADLAAAGGAGLVGFIQPVQGAVARTVRDKALELVSVLDFGAIGGGASHQLSDRFATLAEAQAVYPHASALTDEIDWAALQAAVGALAAGVALSLNGLTLRTNRRVMVTAKTKFVIEGKGATLIAANGLAVVSDNELLSFQGCTDFTLRDLTVDGNRATRVPAEVAAHNLEFRSCQRFTCNQVRSNNAVVDGFIFNTATNTDTATYCSDFLMLNCFADNCYRQGASIINAYHFKFSGGAYTNTNGTAPQAGIDIESNSGAAVGNRHGVIDGVKFEGNAGFSILLSNVSESREFVIQNSHFKSGGLGAIGINTDATHVKNCTFTGHAGAGIAQGIVTFQNQAMTKSGSVTDCTFLGNTNATSCIYTFSTTSGIRIAGNTISDHANGQGMQINGTAHIVEKNNILNTGQLGIATAGTDCKFAYNFILNAVTRGMYSSGGARNRFLFNTVKDVSAVSGGYIQTDDAGTVVTDNTLISTAAAATSFGIYLGGGSVRHTVTDNKFVNLHTTQPIGFAGSTVWQHTIHSNSGGTANDVRLSLSGMADPQMNQGVRPLASTVAPGTCIFNLTTSKPNWSTGVDWVDAAGVAA